MASVNKVILVGYLGKDPETRYTQGGDAICNITVATSESWKDKTTGEKKETTEWHRVVFFGRLAEVAGQYLKKGSQVYLEGKLTTRKWQDKDGQDRYTTEIRGDEMKILSRVESADAPAPSQTPPKAAPSNNKRAAAPAAKPQECDFSDEIPF